MHGRGTLGAGSHLVGARFGAVRTVAVGIGLVPLVERRQVEPVRGLGRGSRRFVHDRLDSSQSSGRPMPSRLRAVLAARTRSGSETGAGCGGNGSLTKPPGNRRLVSVVSFWVLALGARGPSLLVMVMEPPSGVRGKTVELRANLLDLFAELTASGLVGRTFLLCQLFVHLLLQSFSLLGVCYHDEFLLGKIGEGNRCTFLLSAPVHCPRSNKNPAHLAGSF